MQLQDVPCEADDILKGEPSEPGKDQNPSELLPLEDNEDGDGHGKTGDLMYSRKKTKVRFASPEPSDDENPKKRKTWLLSDAEVIKLVIVERR